MDGYCFVIQPYDGAVFDDRFEDIIKPAVEACDLMKFCKDK